MATPISGLHGSVTFAAGYTTIVDQWGANIIALHQDLTPLTPPDDHLQLYNAEPGGVGSGVDLLRSGAGQYTCKLAVPKAATLSGGPHNAFYEEWTLRSFCEVRDITPLGAEWRAFVAALKSTSFELVHYIDDTLVLPLPGHKGAAPLVLTANTGKSYSIPYIIGEVAAGVSTEDIMRRVLLEGAAYEAPGSTGLPLAGDEGSAVLSANDGRQYSGAIVTTSVICSVNRRMSVGGLAIGFVFNGEVQGA